jgi:hypothetical protein
MAMSGNHSIISGSLELDEGRRLFAARHSISLIGRHCFLV